MFERNILRGLMLAMGLALVVALLVPAVALADKEPPEAPGPGIASPGAGGPDDFGYRWKDSNEPDGPTYSWVDITGSGTAIGIGDDTSHGPYDIGFTFNFYDRDYTRFYVNSNGQVLFGGGSNDLGNDCPLPDTDDPENFIAGIWDDLDNDSGVATPGEAYYERFSSGSCPVGGYSGECLVVLWDVYHYQAYETNDNVIFEIVLFDDNDFLIQIQDASSETGSGSTTGIENAYASDGLTYACNASGSIADSLAIQFYHPGVTFVPEASTMILLGSGLAGLAGYASLRLRARRKRE